MPGFAGLCCTLAAITLAGAAPAGAAGPQLGMEDDASLALWPRDPAGLLALGHRHGVQAVRFLVSPAQDLGRFTAATDLAVREGLEVEVTLAAGGLDPDAYRRWAIGAARRLHGHGATTFSVLNEPDLTLPSGSSCEPDAAARVVRNAGFRLVRRTHRHVRVRRVRRWSRRGPRRRIVVRRRVLGPRHSTVVAVPAGERVDVAPTGPVAERSPAAVAVCRRIIRAHVAADYYRSTIPALRAAVPAARVWIGETSPMVAVQQFLETLFSEPLPRVDGFAHHPYARWDGQPSIEDGSIWLDHLDRLPALIHGLPLHLTEFGVMAGHAKARIVDAAGAAEIWREAIRRACAVGARQLVAYQWDPNPPDSDPARWDTSILGPDRATTPALEAFSAARCGPS